MNALVTPIPPKVAAPAPQEPVKKPALPVRLQNLLAALKPEQAVAELARRHNDPGE